jgi:hypothetical protein
MTLRQWQDRYGAPPIPRGFEEVKSGKVREGDRLLVPSSSQGKAWEWEQQGEKPWRWLGTPVADWWAVARKAPKKEAL